MIDYPIDRTGWPAGPWDTEGDLAAWDLPNGLHAVIRRNPIGGWCGYVGLPPGHPWHGRGYNTMVKPDKAMLDRRIDVNELCVISLFCAALGDTQAENGVPLNLAVRVHGGVTFAKHIPVEHNGKEGWWYIGFDCAHSGDSLPGMLQHLSDSYWHHVERHNVYRTEEFVRGETAHLSEELINLPPPCVEIVCPAKNPPHRSRRPKPSRMASPKPTSIKPPIWKLPLPRHAACRQKKTSQKTFGVRIPVATRETSTSS